MSDDAGSGSSGRRGLSELVARISSFLLAQLGKGPGIVGIVYLQTAFGFVLGFYKPETVASFLGGCAAIDIPLFGGSAWKAHKEAQYANGNGEVKP